MDELIEVETEEGILHDQLEPLVHLLEWIAVGVEVLAIIAMLIGVLRYLSSFVRAELSRAHERRVRKLHIARVDLGRYVLAGLELFIVADLIHIALSLKLSDLIFLSLLVVIRTVVSYFLDREIRDLKRDLEKDKVV